MNQNLKSKRQRNSSMPHGGCPQKYLVTHAAPQNFEMRANEHASCTPAAEPCCADVFPTSALSDLNIQSMAGWLFKTATNRVMPAPERRPTFAISHLAVGNRSNSPAPSEKCNPEARRYHFWWWRMWCGGYVFVRLVRGMPHTCGPRQYVRSCFHLL